MDYELYTEDDYAYAADYEIDNQNNESVALEGDDSQRCGICMDVVVDRGVLDCCQHWFCFSCIDNWASITNLCPLCQNEFQLITCVPSERGIVGTGLEGQSALDSVTVYDTIGGVQPDDGSARDDDDDDDEDWSVEGDNNTLSFPSYYIDENAVSCLEGDNCKIRSHSANIEEDPDLDTSIACDSCDLWYHAICVGFNADGSCETSWLCPRCLLDEASQKSEMGPNNLHGSENLSHEHLGNATFPLNMSVSVADAGETAVVVSNINGNQKIEVPYSAASIEGNQEDEERNQIMMPDSDVCAEMEIYNTSGDDNCKLEEQLVEKVIKEPEIEAMELDSCLSQGTSTLVSESLQLLESSGNFREETSVSDRSKTSELYEENSTLESDKDDTAAEVIKKKVSKVRSLPAAKNSDKKERAGGITDAKGKQRDCSAEELQPKTKMVNNFSAKNAKTERRNRVAHSINEPQESVPNDSSNSNKRIVKKRKVVTDIRDIVQGTHHRPSKRLASEETSSGLRIKKIMRRTTDNKDSLVQVQSLRQEIREAIRNRSSKEAGDNIFDPKLLAAFRTALAGQTTETTRPQPLDVKAKKALLQKGTVRENLTKKIYASGGKRKRAWTRDCEIEFWKHRCSKVSKPEKIETLKSVLDLLRKGPTEVKEIKKENTLETGNSILSRLYVADASVFPRTADIKPLSVQPNNYLVNSKETKVAVSCNNSRPAPRKVNPNKSSDESSRSTGGFLVNAQKQTGNGSTDIKSDKKKWALEVLARKTAVAGNNSSQGQDNAVLKGNYPLLAKLPVEMRPSLAPSRHNKIPISVRQAQLYRLTEHFLKKTSMPVTRPTAEIELAVADAINVEKAVADRSNSKLVYVNLCAQELLHRSDNMDCSTAPESEPKPDPTVTGDDIPTNADVDEALRNAGLLSDTPPASPNQYETDDTKEQDGPDNVFEIDPQPELDIYGDFEYDLEDDDFIGANPIKTTKPQQDDTKIKMVFSTLDFDKSDSAWRFEDHKAPVVVENANEDNKKEKSSLLEGGEDENLDECEDIYGPDKEPLINKYPDLKLPDLITENNVAEVKDDQGSNLAAKACTIPNGNCSENLTDLSNKSLEKVEKKEKKPYTDKKQQSDKRSSVFKKVEAYIKEHIRPLCKSGVITVEQYRWAVGKTTDKIMKYHSKDTNANFLIKEGEKVKKLAEQYVETAQKISNEHELPKAYDGIIILLRLHERNFRSEEMRASDHGELVDGGDKSVTVLYVLLS
ncbi:TNF receptor-associated factor [Tanacetum coccineum]